MDRRQFNLLPAPMLIGLLLAPRPALALSIGELTNLEASQGLKAALEQGATTAVRLLGKTDGFLGNSNVRIPLPEHLTQASKLLRALGQGGRLDELLTSMNRAAEAAVPMAKDLLVSAVKSMNVTDAKQILTGGEKSVTDFFVDKTRVPLNARFLPIVTQSVQKVGLVEQYNQLAGKAADMGLLKKQDANLQQYVSAKALDGLYWMIGEEEKKIRQDPVSTGSAILKKVFGALN